jgi:hypothetical protein
LKQTRTRIHLRRRASHARLPDTATYDQVVGRKAIPGETDLATTHPELAAQLVDQTLASQLTAGSHRKVDWQCSEGHDWNAVVSSRARGSGCPFCSGYRAIPGENDLATTHPHLAAELLEPSLAIVLKHQSEKRVLWRCKYGHEFEATPANRTRGKGNCPVCINQKIVPGVNDLATTHPLLAAELVDSELGRQISAGSDLKAEWRCAVGHEWTAVVQPRASRGIGCPYCSGKRAIIGETDLGTLRPDLARELAVPAIQRSLTLYSNQSVAWRCEFGHEWMAQVTWRARGNGCPVCSNRDIRPGVNDLATTHPELAQRLVDRSLAVTISRSSGTRVAWRCERGHEWVVSPSKVRGCPYCSGQRPIVGETDLATTRPDLAAELVNPDLASKLMAKSARRVRWRCQQGHTWTVSPANRTSKGGTGCPECAVSGFSAVSPGWLYLLATPGRTVYKFGITNVLDQRLANHARQGFTEVVETIYFDVGADAAEVERRIKAHVKAQGWQPPMTAKSMPYGGASETLSVHDVGEGFTLTAFLAGFDD